MLRGLTLLFFFALGISLANVKPTITAVNLRCEFRQNPLGIDTSLPRLSWVLEGPGRRQRQSAYRIIVASSASKLATNRGDVWDSGKVISGAPNHIVYGGIALSSYQECFWKVQIWDGGDILQPWSQAARWEMALLRDSDWLAEWINDGKDGPQTGLEFYEADPAPLFRKSFNVGKAIRRARLYITGLGYYEAFLNGTRVGDQVLDPGWTAFSERVLYSSFDVTSSLIKGKNVLGVQLGNGWYNPVPMKMWGNLNLREHLTTGRPRFIAQLRLDFRDGSTEFVRSDTSWRVTDGPILRNNVYLGEEYDARKEAQGWDKAGFDDSPWRRPGRSKEPTGRLTAQAQPPIRVTKQWHPVTVTEPKPGVFIYDFGTNFAGWAKVSLSQPRGTRVLLRYGELLHADGNLNPMTSVAGQIKGGQGGPGAPKIAWQADTYVCAGGTESYTPRFTFRGFRYLEITGIASGLPLSAVTGLRLNADVESVGSFECSNPMLNSIQQMCRQTFLSNLFSVQSDCPHREKMGYGGDIIATSEAMSLNFDMATFYAKATRDFADSARPDGMFTDTAPFMGIQYCGVVWAMAHPHLIDQLYRYYGDSRIGAEQYEAAKKWLTAVERQNPTGIVSDGLSDHEGLGPAPADAMVTPFYYRSAKLLAEAALRLNRTEDANHFLQLQQEILNAYQSRFILADGWITPSSQASQAVGLATGVGPKPAQHVAMLLRAIQESKEHLTTGILGTKFMLDELSKAGHADVAYRIVTRKDFPGWGYMLQKGATTLWEHWEYSDNTFSHNHPMFGSVSQWMINWLGGIQLAPDSVGFDRIVVRPQLVPGLDWVRSSYRSIRGRITSNWRRGQDRATFEVMIPSNTTATVYLPARSSASVQESGKDITQAEGVLAVSEVAGIVRVTIGSGSYHFSVASKSEK